jgi:hypothetical protein
MPTVSRIGPHRFFFYSGDRGEPPHIHVQREDRVGKFWLEPVRLRSNGGFGRQELRRIEDLVRTVSAPVSWYPRLAYGRLRNERSSFSSAGEPASIGRNWMKTSVSMPSLRGSLQMSLSNPFRTGFELVAGLARTLRPPASVSTRARPSTRSRTTGFKYLSGAVAEQGKWGESTTAVRDALRKDRPPSCLIATVLAFGTGVPTFRPRCAADAMGKQAAGRPRRR